MPHQIAKSSNIPQIDIRVLDPDDGDTDDKKSS
jgi:hypothetical protein